jgi:hypothetical protein
LRCLEKVKAELSGEKLSLVVTLMFSDVPSTHNSALNILGALFADEKIRATFGKSKQSLGRLVVLLQSTMDRTILLSAAAIGKLTNGNIKIGEALSKAGATERLLQLINHPSEAIREHAVYTLSALAHGNGNSLKKKKKKRKEIEITCWG